MHGWHVSWCCARNTCRVQVHIHRPAVGGQHFESGGWRGKTQGQELMPFQIPLFKRSSTFTYMAGQTLNALSIHHACCLAKFPCAMLAAVQLKDLAPFTLLNGSRGGAAHAGGSWRSALAWQHAHACKQPAAVLPSLRAPPPPPTSRPLLTKTQASCRATSVCGMRWSSCWPRAGRSTHR